MTEDFQIRRLLEITDNQKYAATVAAFELVDLIDQVSVPKDMLNRKPSIKAMQVLSDKGVQYDFIEDELRLELQEKLGDEDEYATYARPSASEVAEQIFTDDEDDNADEDDEDLKNDSTEKDDEVDENAAKLDASSDEDSTDNPEDEDLADDDED